MLNRSQKEMMFGALRCFVQIFPLIVLQFSDCILGQQLFTIDSSIRYTQSFQSIIVDSALQCCGICGEHDSCVAVSYETNTGICELNNRNPPLDNYVDGTSISGWMSYSTNIAPCLPGWHQYLTHCYEYINTKRNWLSSESHCQGLGGHLVDINSSAENDFVHSIITGLFWIGINDREEEGVLRWPLSVGVSFTSFYETELNGGADENRVEMGNREWYDTGCSQLLSSVCKKEFY